MVQHKDCFAITGAIQGTSIEWPYDELGLMSLKVASATFVLVCF